MTIGKVLFRRFKQSKLIHNIGKVMMGSGVAQAITFLATLVLVRMYNPESFGLQSALLALIGPIVSLTSMAFPVAIVVARNDENAAALARLAWIGSLVASPFVVLALIFRDGWLLNYLSLSEMQPYIMLLPILMVALTLSSSASHHMTRAQAFGLMSRASIASAAVGSIAKFLFGLLGPGPLGLIMGNLLGYLVIPFMARRLRPQSESAPLKLTHLKAAASEHSDFPLFRAPQNFIWALAQSIPIIFLTSGFGTAAAGHFAVALALAGAPMMLVGNAVQSVLYPHVTTSVQAGVHVSRLLWFATGGAFLAGITLLLPIVLFGADLFEIILGSMWREAGLYAAMLTPWLLFTLASRPALAIVPALKLQRGLLIYEILSSILKALAMVSGIILIGTDTGALLLFSLSSAFASLILILWVHLTEYQRARNFTHKNLEAV